MSGHGVKCKVANSFYAFTGAEGRVRELARVKTRIVPVFSCRARGYSAQFKATGRFVRRIYSVAKGPKVHALRRTRPVKPGKCLSIVIVTPYAKGSTTGLTGTVASAPILVTTGTRVHGKGPLMVTVSAGSTLKTDFGGVKVLVGAGRVCFIPFTRSGCRGGPGSVITGVRLLPRAVSTTLRKGRLRPIMQKWGDPRASLSKRTFAWSKGNVVRFFIRRELHTVP